MIRYRKIFQFAMIAGLVCPAFGQDQEANRAEPAPIEITTGRPTQTEASVIQEDVFGGEDHDGAKAATIRRIYRTQPAQYSFTIHNESLESKFGLNLAPIDEALRSQLEIPKGEGIVILEVKPKSLAEQAGLKARDILLSVGDKPIKGVPAAQGLLLDVGKEAVSIKLIREGKPRQLSLVGPEHGFTAESDEFWIGVPVSPVDPILRSHLSELPADAGLIANDVVKDSPADKAGVKKNDILVSMGGQPLKSSETLIAQVQASEGKPVALVVLRGGKTSTVEVTPTKRTHPTVVNFRASPVRSLFRVVEPNVAIQVPPASHPQTRVFRRGQGGVHEERIASTNENLGGIPPTRYDRIIVNPYHIDGAPLGGPSQPQAFAQGPIDINLEMFTNRAKANVDEATGRIEAQLKALTARVEELRKAIDDLKKPEEK